jgi:hypothetical protein
MFYAICSLDTGQSPPPAPNFDTFTGCSAYYFDLLRTGAILNYRVYKYSEWSDPNALNAKYALMGRIMKAEVALTYPYTPERFEETYWALIKFENDYLEANALALEKQIEPIGERAPEIL